MTDIDNDMNNSGTPEAAAPDGTPEATADKENEKREKSPGVWARIRGSRITVSVLAVLLVTAPLVATRLVALATGSGKLGSHYLSDSELYVPFTVTLICTLILSLLPFLLLDRSRLEGEHLVPRIMNLIPAIGAAFTAYLFFYFSTARVFEGEDKWALYISLSACVAAVYFILKIIGNSVLPNVMSGLRILTAIGVFVLCALIIVSLYLDYDTELNSHFKLSVQFGAVGIMLGTMADARSALGQVSKRRYLSFKAIALTLTSTGAASVLVRAFDEIEAFKQKQGIAALSVDDLVTHFQSSPSASASYVICSLLFVTYSACVIAEIIFGAIAANKSRS